MTRIRTALIAWVSFAFLLGLTGCVRGVCGTDDDDTNSAGDDDTKPDDDDIEDDDTKPDDDDIEDDDTGDDDSSAGDDDDSSADDDTGDDDTAAPCDPLGPGVTPTLVFNDPGWQITVFATGYDMPTGLASDSAGDLLVGAGVETWDSRPVHRITPAGVATASDPIPDPDGVGVDAADQVYAAGSDDIWHVNTLMPGGDPDEVWHALSTGSNINDFLVDDAHDDAIYLELDDGRVLKVAQDHTETVLITASDNPAIDVDAAGHLWVLDNDGGALSEIDPVGGGVVSHAQWATLDPDYLTTNRIAFDPADGRLYASTYLTGDGGTIARWDPANPGSLELWISQMTGDDNPDDLLWLGGCLYITTPLNGQILRVCECP